MRKIANTGSIRYPLCHGGFETFVHHFMNQRRICGSYRTTNLVLHRFQRPVKLPQLFRSNAIDTLQTDCAFFSSVTAYKNIVQKYKAVLKPEKKTTP